MSRPDVLQQLPTHPTRRAMAQARRAVWEPDARDVEIARLHDEEGLTIRTIATQVGLSSSRVGYLYHRYKIRMEERTQREHEEADGERAPTMAREVVPGGTNWGGAPSLRGAERPTTPVPRPLAPWARRARARCTGRVGLSLRS